MNLPPAAQPKPGDSKLAQVRRLLDVLQRDFKDPALSPADRNAVLEQLKIFGRDPRESDPIFSQSGIETLCQLGSSSDTETSRGALRVLANALVLAPQTRQMLVDFGFAGTAAEKLGSGAVDDEFLCARILFLVTYGTTVELRKLVEEHGLEEDVESALERHAGRIAKGKTSEMMAEMALAEMLKLVFNVCHFYPEKDEDKGAKLFTKSIASIFGILSSTEIAKPPLQPPTSLLINALLSIDFSSHTSSVFPPTDETVNVARLVALLYAATKPIYTTIDAPKEVAFDEVGAPLITLLRKIVSTAPDSTKAYLKSQLLPAEEDRDQPLGKGDKLPARLLQLSTSAATPNTRENIAYLLFELSSSSAEEFIHNVGYGYASGFLMTHNIALPEGVVSGETADPSVNPVTGQRWENEEDRGDPFEGMTDAEKEREAERLFVLFERLRATGVVDVQNPIRQAVEEGRFEELPDDDVD